MARREAIWRLEMVDIATIVQALLRGEAHCLRLAWMQPDAEVVDTMTAAHSIAQPSGVRVRVASESLPETRGGGAVPELVNPVTVSADDELARLRAIFRQDYLADHDHLRLVYEQGRADAERELRMTGVRVIPPDILPPPTLTNTDTGETFRIREWNVPSLPARTAVDPAVLQSVRDLFSQQTLLEMSGVPAEYLQPGSGNYASTFVMPATLTRDGRVPPASHPDVSTQEGDTR